MHEVKYLRDQNGWRASNLLDSTQVKEYMSAMLVRVKGGIYITDVKTLASAGS